MTTSRAGAPLDALERPSLRYFDGESPAAPGALEIADGLLWIRMPVPFGVEVVNLWAIREGEGWALVDTGVHNEATVSAWESLLAADGPLQGRPVTRVFVSHMHPDHLGMAGWLTRRFGCALWMCSLEFFAARASLAEAKGETPPDELAFLHEAGWEPEALAAYRSERAAFAELIHPLPAAHVRLEDDRTLRIGAHDWRVIVGVGHTQAHASLYCPALGTLISGDQIIARISSNVSVTAAEPRADSLGRWLASLAKMRRVAPPDVLVLPSHNEPFRGLHAQIDYLDAGHRRSLWGLWQQMDEPIRAVDALPLLFSRPVGAHPTTQLLAIGESLANLNHLLARGCVERRLDARGVAWWSRRPDCPPSDLAPEASLEEEPIT
ncbi:MAG TPA: MBL fold metallo-hydrolase [Ramlibacter sp.]|nr:MBL fold metallo-hydrolase [Ramlibacter sp.]